MRDSVLQITSGFFSPELKLDFNSNQYSETMDLIKEKLLGDPTLRDFFIFQDEYRFTTHIHFDESKILLFDIINDPEYVDLKIVFPYILTKNAVLPPLLLFINEYPGLYIEKDRLVLRSTFEYCSEFSSNDPFWDKELLLPRFIHLAYIAYTLLPSIEDICSGRLPALYKDRVRDVFKQAIAYYAKEESDMFYNSGSGLSKSAEYLERMNDED